MDELLQLLRSNVNEKKFAGLLLATKFLPAGDDKAITAVHDAVGITFINRLLLPLRSTSGQGLAADDQEDVRIASAGLGLAVLAGFSRVRELAQSQEIIQNVPLLLKVLRSSGLSAILHSTDTATAQQSVDLGSVHDALECLTSVTAASEEGRTVALQSGALAAAATMLQDAKQHAELAPLATAFLSALLHTPDRLQLLSDDAASCAATVPPLASMLATPPQPAAPAAVASQASGQGATWGGGPQAVSSAADPEATTTAAAAEADAGALGAQMAAGISDQPLPPAKQQPQQLQPETDAAATQLQVLHTLLLLLPPPEGSELFRLLSTSAAGKDAAWPGDLRTGVSTILGSKVPPATRQAALAVAAAVVGLAGPSWLAGAVQQGKATSSSSKPKRGAFYQLVVEVAAIETQVLLTDALRPLDSAPKKTSGPSVQQTAEMMLPICFQLLEAAVEVLAADEEEATPLLSSKVAGRALESLNVAFEAVLQYLEEALKPGGAGDGPVTLAALRALARYLSDLPQAWPGRVRALLPALLTVTGGSGSNMPAVAFLLPLLKQATGLGGAEAAATGASSETDAWLRCIQQPQVVTAIARAVVEGATAAVQSPAEDAEDERYILVALTDMCNLLLHRVSPSNPRNEGMFGHMTAERTSASASSDRTAGLSEQEQRLLLGSVAAVSRWWSLQHAASSAAGDVSAVLPDADTVRFIMAAGTLSAAVLATTQQREADDAVGLVLAALQAGFRVSCDLQRPEGVHSDEEMTELVDQVQEQWNDALLAVAAVAANDAQLRERLKAEQWVRQLMAAPPAVLLQRLRMSETIRRPPADALLQLLRQS